MPIVRIRSRVVYFAHVPKCAGTAVERYLIRRFGRKAVALLDSSHYVRPAATRWSRGSPQHIDRASLARLFPAGFFDASFAMVRHPALRLRSVFLFQRDVERRLDPGQDFSAWLEQLPEAWARDGWYLDNHTRPMGELMPGGTRAFRLEEGTAPLVAWLDGLAGDRDGAREIGVDHSYQDRLAAIGAEPGPEVRLGEDDLARIAELYAEDYARFGYAAAPGELAGPVAGG